MYNVIGVIFPKNIKQCNLFAIDIYKFLLQIANKRLFEDTIF